MNVYHTLLILVHSNSNKLLCMPK